MMKYFFTLALLMSPGSCGGPDKCPIFQTTNIDSPCYLLVSETLDGGPVPPFVYAFTLPHPSARQPCPVLQSLDPTQRCYFSTGHQPLPAFKLVYPLPADADTVEESHYVTKRPELLSFPNPKIVIQ